MAARMPLDRGSRIPALLAAIIAVAACTPQPSVRHEVAAATPDAQARALLAAGDAAGAAAEYRRLAEAAQGGTAAPLWLGACAAHLSLGDVAAAGDALARADAAGPDGLDADRRALQGRLALAGGDAAGASALLAGIDPAALRVMPIRDLLAAQALAAGRAGQPLAEGRARSALDALLPDDAARAANRAALWSALGAVPSADLDAAVAGSPAPFDGWLELARLARTEIFSAERFAPALQAWQARFPGHPATAIQVPELQATAGAIGTPPRRVALLLPLHGRFAAAGAAVRDGFLAAWYADPAGGARPPVLVLDAGPQTAASAYASAVGQGADYVVGPLDKESLEALVAAGAVTKTTLALNYLDPAPAGTAPNPRLYQFGLGPEDEAGQVAERAWFDGHQRALAMVPSGAWGDRLLHAFRTRWLALGGELLEERRYPADTRDYAPPSKALLDVDASEARAAEVRRAIGRDLRFEPRRRQDADFVFMPGFPLQGRQLRPQLEYFGAGRLPAYATSHMFGGARDSERDRDLNGVTFGDMPWIVDPGARDAALYDQLRSAWPAAGAGGNARLYALGIDAYRLLGHLGRLRAQPEARLQGQTGSIGIDAQGRASRRLRWATFRNGIPVLADGPLAAR